MYFSKRLKHLNEDRMPTAVGAVKDFAVKGIRRDIKTAAGAGRSLRNPVKATAGAIGGVAKQGLGTIKGAVTAPFNLGKAVYKLGKGDKLGAAIDASKAVGGATRVGKAALPTSYIRSAAQGMADTAKPKWGPEHPHALELKAQNPSAYKRAFPPSAFKENTTIPTFQEFYNER